MLISNGGGFTGTFSARNSNSINYESPRFSGFSVLAQTTSTAEQRNTLGAPNVGGRSNSFGLNYGAGPLTASLAYTQLEHNRAASGVTNAQDTALSWVPRNASALPVSALCTSMLMHNRSLVKP